eukprot:12584509-Ditylum_brightwellii.AAC.1
MRPSSKWRLPTIKMAAANHRNGSQFGKKYKEEVGVVAVVVAVMVGAVGWCGGLVFRALLRLSCFCIDGQNLRLR